VVSPTARAANVSDPRTSRSRAAPGLPAGLGPARFLPLALSTDGTRSSSDRSCVGRTTWPGICAGRTRRATHGLGR